MCITIPSEADMMMYIDSVERIIIDELYISRISRVFILIVIYSESLSWSSQLFENVVEFCWCWIFITNSPVLSSIACWNVPHNIYCLIGLAMDCACFTAGMSEIIFKFQTVPPLRVDLDSTFHWDGGGVSCTDSPYLHTICTNFQISGPSHPSRQNPNPFSNSTHRGIKQKIPSYCWGFIIQIHLCL